ncbi:PAS domain S-box protein [Neorhizobium sp. DAR64860/K0K1]|uniref:PAS domain S-box protein n=1 Tax=Neorhizobium sp. DAR64860/K0K1 TaxID=3421955 RepID=UPI003D2C714C
MDSNQDRVQVHQLAAGLKEGVILLDLERKFLWANEAAVAMHGLDDQKQLGNSLSEYRSRFDLKYRNNHKVGDGDHPVDRVIATGSAADVTMEVRPTQGGDQSWMHDSRCFMVSEKDKNAYVAWIFQDETRRYEAEDRFEAAFNANPAPAVICRLSDLRYVRVNPGFLEMTGYSRSDLVGKTTYEIDVLAFAEKRELALAKLKEGRTIPQMGAIIPLRERGAKTVIVAGEPIDVSGEPCMLFTFADVEPLKKAQQVLKQSEERFSKAFGLSPVPTVIVRTDNFEVIEANAAFFKLIGSPEELVIGKSQADLDIWLDKDVQKVVETALLKDGRLRDIDFRLKSRDGALMECLLSSEEIKIDDIPCIMMVIQDITDRKRSEEELMSAIESVMADTSWFSRGIVEKLAALRQRSPLPDNITGVRVSELTEREQDILTLICQGMNDQQMSQQLGLSSNTVRNHVSSLYRKIGVNRRGAAILWAKERGIGGSDRARTKPD